MGLWLLVPLTLASFEGQLDGMKPSPSPCEVP